MPTHADVAAASAANNPIRQRFIDTLRSQPPCEQLREDSRCAQKRNAAPLPILGRELRADSACHRIWWGSSSLVARSRLGRPCCRAVVATSGVPRPSPSRC